MKPTTQRRALQAVADGRVIRSYYDDGSKIRGGGTNGVVLWELVNAGMIEDGDAYGGLRNTYKMQLSPTGRAALAHNES